MVKDIPIPEGIFAEFQPFTKDKESLAKLFDNLDCCVLCDEKRKEEDMPSQTKGQNCLDRYFVKINSQKNSSTCESEMGKKSTNNNSVHNVSSSSDSEKNETNLKTLNTKNHMAIELDATSDEAFQIEPTPSKPIIAAMNALGKLKQDIAKVTVDDNSSRDSTALVIDEEQLEPEKDPSPDIEETPQIKASSRKSNDGIQSSKSSKDKITSSNNKPPLVNESLNFSNFFNSSKVATSSQIGRFSTSTPVEDDKSGKRKRTDDDESCDQPSSKKPKEKNVKFDKESWLESMRENDDMIEVKNFKDGDCPLFVEDLESDDELYVVQCPKEIDLESLVGKNLKLNGETRFKLDVNGTNQLYECFAEKDTMGRHVNMILPSRKEEKFKFGVYHLNGSVVISEGFGDPDEEDSSSDEGEMKITIDSKKDIESKKLNEPKEKSLEKVKKHKKKRDNSDIEQTPEEVIKGASNERGMSDPDIKSSEHDNDNVKKNLCEPSNEQHEFTEKTAEKVKKHKKKRDNAVTVKEEVITSLKDAEENISSVKKKKKRKETSEEKIMESTEKTSHSDGDHEKVENKNKRAKDSEFSVEGVTSVIIEEKKIKKEKKDKTEEKQMDQEVLKMEVVEEIVTKKKKKKKHHDEAENIEPVTELKQLPIEISKQELVEAQDSNSDGTVKKKKKKKDKDIKAVSVETSVESDEPVVTEETVIKKKKKKKHHDQGSDQPVIDLDAEEESIPKVNEGDSRNHFILSSFVETDDVSLKKRKKKKKKKEKEKSEDD